MAREASKRQAIKPQVAEARQRARRMWLDFFSIVGWTVTLLGVGIGFQYLERYVQGAQAPAECRLEWKDLPAWLKDTPSNQWVLSELAVVADLRPDDSVFDPRLCERVGESLKRSPWISAVKSVTKRPDGLVTVRAEFRQPAALVQDGKRAYLVDATGLRLPPDYAIDQPGLSAILMITGVLRPLPQVGEPWGGEDLEAGLKLVAFLQEAMRSNMLPFWAELRAVDVSNYFAKNSFDGKLRILTIYPGCYIDWGLPPGEEFDVDTASASRKLDMLNALYLSQGRFPERILTVRWAEEIVQREPRKR